MIVVAALPLALCTQSVEHICSATGRVRLEASTTRQRLEVKQAANQLLVVAVLDERSKAIVRFEAWSVP